MVHNPDERVVVLPGDEITSLVKDWSKGSVVKLGPGLCELNEDVITNKSGILRFKEPGTFWVDCHQKRYIPCKGENVLGVVTGKQGDFYKVDIGSSDQALLNSLSFEGASKRNKPNIVNGDVVFARLTSANKHMEPEISCVDSNGKANGLGVITDTGCFFQTSLNLVQKILCPDCVLLPELGSRLAFEIIVGLNGKIAVFCKSTWHTITLMNLIKSAEYLTNEQILNVLQETFM